MGGFGGEYFLGGMACLMFDAGWGGDSIGGSQGSELVFWWSWHRLCVAFPCSARPFETLHTGR